MEIVIHKDGKQIRVTEMEFTKDGKLGQAIVYSTVYVCKNKKGKIVVETINPSTLQIIDSEYILTKDKKLLRVTSNDTITFQLRY
jgi:translation elongation factor P/translation initiation factor 5A